MATSGCFIINRDPTKMPDQHELPQAILYLTETDEFGFLCSLQRRTGGSSEQDRCAAGPAGTGAA